MIPAVFRSFLPRCCAAGAALPGCGIPLLRQLASRGGLRRDDENFSAEHGDLFSALPSPDNTSSQGYVSQLFPSPLGRQVIGAEGNEPAIVKNMEIVPVQALKVEVSASWNAMAVSVKLYFRQTRETVERFQSAAQQPFSPSLSFRKQILWVPAAPISWR